MAIDSEESISLPVPPPPRPAARRDAIESALRKFDGLEPASPPRRRFSLSQWASAHRAAAGGLVTAALVAVIAVPAIQIALRDNAPGVVSDMGPPSPATGNPPASNPAAANEPAPAQAGETAAPAGEAAASTEAGPPQPERVSPSTPAEARSTTPVVMSDRAPLAKAPAPATSGYAPAPAMAPPPAPPAPPPPPPPEAAKEAYGAVNEDSLVVTGSRIPQSNLARQKSAARRDEEASSPLAIIDPYGPFLSRLQAAFRANDRGAVLRLVALPLRVNFPGGSRIYRTRQDIERDYAGIFTPAVRQAALTLRPDTLTTRDGGRLKGNGRIWLGCGSRSCTTEAEIRLREINP